MHPTSKLIEQLLQDDSFPSMAILDGAWGEGKTHFARNTLLKELEKDNYKTFYLSLTGISDISDYRDRLLSVSFETIGKTSQIFKKHANSIGSLIDPSGLTGALISGGAGFLREKLLHKLNNIRFIIDDLDRIEDEKLVSLIVGESLQLADSELKKIQFVFVVNESKSCLDSNLREKAFSGVVYLNMDIQDLIDIAFQGKNINSNFLDSITETIKEKGIKNLRVLKRIANKAKKINDIIINDNTVDQKLSFSYLGKNITLICHYLYEKGYNSKKVWDSINESSLLEYINSKEGEEESLHKDLQTIEYGVSEVLVRYCAFEISNQINIENLGQLPLKTSKIDSLLYSPAGGFKNEEFESLIIELKNFIFDEVNVPLKKWFRACEYYEKKVRHSFIYGDADDFIRNFENLCSKKEFYREEYEISWGEPDLKSENEIISNNYQIFFDKEKVKEKKTSDKKIIDDMIISWKDIDLKVYKSHQLKPFFNIITIKNWNQCLNNWTPLDLEFFADFVNDRYKESNVKHYLINEYYSLHTLKSLIMPKLQELPTSQQKGSLTLVSLALEKAIERLTS